MDATTRPRAARFALSHGAAAPAQADKPIDWRQANMDMNSRLAPKFRDHAFPILYGEPTINDSQRSDLWDLFHQSANANELEQHLSGLNLHPDLKKQLSIAKNKPSFDLDPVDKVVGAIHRMSTLDTKTLDLAENYPSVFKALLASREE